MIKHKIRVYAAKELLARQDQLAYKIATVAADVAPIDSQSAEMVINRIIGINGPIRVNAYCRISQRLLLDFSRPMSLY